MISLKWAALSCCTDGRTLSTEKTSILWRAKSTPGLQIVLLKSSKTIRIFCYH